MGLTFQVPMQYCSLQHWTLLQSPVTSTTGCCFCFGFVSLFFLELFLHCSPVAYWAPADGAFLFQYSIFLPFHTVHGFSRQEYWRPFPSPVDHILSELSTVTRPSWVAPHSMAHIFFELNKTVVHKCNRFFQEEEDNRFWTIGKSFWGTKSCLWVRWK